MNKKQVIYILLFFLSVTSCKKDKDDDKGTQGTQNTCPTNSGYFEIDMGGNEHTLKVDNETNFTILYNWYEVDGNSIVITGNDQNDKSIYIEGTLPNELTVGTHAFNNNQYFDFFDIGIDTFSLYTSELTFEITQSNLNTQEGVYKPIRGTFTGTAHSYPWSSVQPPSDTISYSGKFCLNGLIF